MKLQDFLVKSDCEDGLMKLMGEVIPAAIKKIKTAIENQAGEFAGSKNVYDEHQLALGLQANKIILDELKKSGLVSFAASEEMEEPAILRQAQNDMFAVVFDPLDGSSLVDVNFAVGSIFGLYKGGNPVGKTGDDQVAACYAVYGPHTTLVLTVKKGTHEFRLNCERTARARRPTEHLALPVGGRPSLKKEDGHFYLTKENLKIAPDAKHFAPGNLRAAAEREEYLKLTNEWIKKGLTLRYSGGMVPDINHIILKGNGIFTYPGYSKAPQGKLRLLFECNPMALLVEQADGAATDSKTRILSEKIEELHQRTPIYIGSKNEVQNAGNSL